MSCCCAVLENFRHSSSRCRGVTNLIVYHGIADIISNTGQSLRVLDVVEEPRYFPPFCQWFQLPECLFQFPGDLASGLNPDFNTSEIPSERLSPLYLLDLALRSRGAQ